MSEWKNAFCEMQRDYLETMDAIHDEMNEILSMPDSECSEADAPEYIESAIAESHNKTITSVIGGAMAVLGKCIDSTVSAYDSDDDYNGSNDFCKGDHLCVNKLYHAIYVGFEKVIYYSKGYDLFPEVKVVSLGSFAKKGSISVVKSTAYFPPDAVVRRAMSKLGSSGFKNSESFVKWCKGE